MNSTIEQIKQYLEDNRLTQYRLAQLLGAPATTVNRWLTGKAKISPVYKRLLRDNNVITEDDNGTV